MTVVSKISAIALACGMIAAMTSPSLAAWIVVTTSSGQCKVLHEDDRQPAETQVAGPFVSQEEALKALREDSKCQGS